MTRLIDVRDSSRLATAARLRDVAAMMRSNRTWYREERSPQACGN